MQRIDIAHTSLFAESWNVAWRKRTPGMILEDKEEPFIILENSWRYWAADPFVFEYDGRAYIFAELYDYIRRRGIIGYYQLDENRRGKWIPVIIGERHMSYPCVVERQGKIYMMPETSQDSVLDIYEAVRFPVEWKKVRCLRDQVRFADTTPILDGNGRFALTFQIENVYSPQLMLIDLCGKSADTVVQSESALKTRPAGRPFVFREKNIRPAQNSSDYADGYGKSLIFYEYQYDTNGNYAEKAVAEIKPQELCYSRCLVLDGMHTYNVSENYEVIDIKTRRFNLLNFFFRMIGKIERRMKR